MRDLIHEFSYVAIYSLCYSKIRAINERNISPIFVYKL